MLQHDGDDGWAVRIRRRMVHSVGAVNGMLRSSGMVVMEEVVVLILLEAVVVMQWRRSTVGGEEGTESQWHLVEEVERVKSNGSNR